MVNDDRYLMLSRIIIPMLNYLIDIKAYEFEIDKYKGIDEHSDIVKHYESKVGKLFEDFNLLNCEFQLMVDKVSYRF